MVLLDAFLRELDAQKRLELLVRSAKPRVIREAFYLASMLDFRETEVRLSVSNAQNIEFSIDHITLRAGAHGRLRMTIDKFSPEDDAFVTTIAKDKEWR